MHRGVPAELAEADVIALNTDGEIRAARGATAAGQAMIAFSGGVIDTDTLYHENMHQWWGDNVSEGGYRMTFYKEGLATLAEFFYHARLALS